MIRKMAFSVIMPLLALWVVGCSDNQTTNPEATPAVTEDFGGYTTADEVPAFGDEELVAAEAEEQEVDDPLLASAAVQEVVNDVNAGIFHLRATWGMIPCDSTVTAVTDWTGSLTISRGAIVLRRLIRFEPSTDYVQPRTERTLLEWVSLTTVASDGVAVDLFVPPALPTLDSSWIVGEAGDSSLVIDTIPADPVTVTFATGPYSRTFTLAELAKLDEVVALDDGNSVAFHSLQMFRQVCPRGALAGMWGYDEAGQGVFKGLWMSGYGRLIGYVEGSFGQDSLGANIFHGKWIDASGEFQGLLRGTWGWHARGNDKKTGPGWFSGEIFDAEANPIGLLNGHFKSSKNYQAGWFQGRWKKNCTDVEIGSGSGEIYDDGISSQN